MLNCESVYVMEDGNVRIIFTDSDADEALIILFDEKSAIDLADEIKKQLSLKKEREI